MFYKHLSALALATLTATSQANVLIIGVLSDKDAAFNKDASSTDLVNQGSPALSSVKFSTPPHKTTSASNNGTVGSPNNLHHITFWINAKQSDTYTITYNLDTSTNSLGYDIDAIQTIHGWSDTTGHQKNQTYVVEVSKVGSNSFSKLTEVNYSPLGAEKVTASSKVNIINSDDKALATGVQKIRFTYTIPKGATSPYPSPTIREIDVVGKASTN